MKTGLPQQQPLNNNARVRSAANQQHGAHMWRSSVPHGAPTVAIPSDEEKSASPPLKR